jgi:hypothetical protein
MSTRIATLDKLKPFKTVKNSPETRKERGLVRKMARMRVSESAAATQAKQCARPGDHGPSGSGSKPATK